LPSRTGSIITEATTTRKNLSEQEFLTVTSSVTALNRDINIFPMIDSVGDAFGTKEKKEYLGHVTLLR
jgi:hypothetical protein